MSLLRLQSSHHCGASTSCSNQSLRMEHQYHVLLQMLYLSSLHAVFRSDLPGVFVVWSTYRAELLVDVSATDQIIVLTSPGFPV